MNNNTLQLLAMLGWFLTAATAALAEQDRIHREMVENLKAYAVYKMGNHEEAFAAWMALAQKGNTQGILNVANMYQAGEGVAKDPAQAFHWYQKGAQQGDPLALYNIARAYDAGLGTPADARQARVYFERAADAGSVDAQRRLAGYFLDANDQSQARRWLQRAADNGDWQAQAQLDAMQPDRRTHRSAVAPEQRLTVRELLVNLDDAANARDAAWLTNDLTEDCIILVRLPGNTMFQKLTKPEYQQLWQSTFDQTERYRFTRTYFDVSANESSVQVQSVIREYLTNNSLTKTLQIDEQLELQWRGSGVVISGVQLDVSAVD